ncbi:MAG TPA: phosphotransferase [Trebonia sp.]
MSFWQHLEPSGGGAPDEGTIGSMLRDLHAALRGYPDALPVLAPLGDIPAFLGRSGTMLCAADIAMLGEAYTRLTAELAPASAPGQVLHGDAGAGNLMATSGRRVWHDFEAACAGPVEWDLAATTASPRFDRSRIQAAYGGTADPARLRVCEDLRRLHLTIWYALYAERLPGCRPRATDLLSAWRNSRSFR